METCNTQPKNAFGMPKASEQPGEQKRTQDHILGSLCEKCDGLNRESRIYCNFQKRSLLKPGSERSTRCGQRRVSGVSDPRGDKAAAAAASAGGA